MPNKSPHSHNGFAHIEIMIAVAVVIVVTLVGIVIAHTHTSPSSKDLSASVTTQGKKSKTSSTLSNTTQHVPTTNNQSTGTHLTTKASTSKSTGSGGSTNTTTSSSPPPAPNPTPSQDPTLSVSSPAEGAVITSDPLHLECTYTTPAGFASALVSLDSVGGQNYGTSTPSSDPYTCNIDENVYAEYVPAGQYIVTFSVTDQNNKTVSVARHITIQ